jgi:predicted negative regulator of RcsB-dependent stress response
VGTNKLTRKEIVAEDPVHGALVHLIEYLKVRSRTIGYIVIAVVVLSLGVYGGIRYLEYREMQAQERLAQGIAFFHAQITPDATNDPYVKGHVPAFKSDAAKYQAAAKEFSSLVSGYSRGKVSIIARYYLGLAQLQLGQKKEAAQNLESVANNSRDRLIGNLSKKVLARIEAISGNNTRSKEILEGMIKDQQCSLPKQDISIQLSQVLVAMDKRDEAIKVLRNASSQGTAFGMLQQQVTAELEKIQKGPKTPVHP